MKFPLFVSASLGLASAAFSATTIRVDPAIRPFVPSEVKATGVQYAIGSDAMEGLNQRWVAIYKRAHPEAIFTYAVEEKFNAIPSLGNGKAQYAPLGRLPAKSEVLQFVEETGYWPTPIKVSLCTFTGGPNKDWPHPHAVFVHKSNPLTKLTLTQVDAIFSKTRRRGYPTDITTWGQLGLTGEWADKTIVLYGVNGGEGNRGPASFFSERALASGPFKDLHGAPSEEFVVPMVEKDRYGIGFTGLPFESPGVKHLAIAEKEGDRYSDGSLADVAAGKYPLSRNLFIHIDRRPSMPIDPAVKEMIRIALSREGQEAAVAEGYLPLSAKDVAEELARLDYSFR